MAIRSLLLTALCLAGTTTSVYVGRNEAGIALYSAKTVSSANLTTLDCSPQTLENEFAISIGTCIYGSHFLVNNFKITHMPKCHNGDKAVAIFYEGTTCTGTPTFRSDKTDEDIHSRCLFGSSPRRWSLIFRCEDFESQALKKYDFFHATLPGKATNYNVPSQIKFEPTDGIVTPYYSTDCTVYRPKPPTFLPADTCLPLEVGNSIFVRQRVICANGELAWLHTYADSSCSGEYDLLSGETYAGSRVLSASMEKQCHRTDARSVAYVCKDSEMKMFEDLPPHMPKKVEPLVLLDPLPASVLVPEPAEVSKPETQKAAGGGRQNNWVSVEWDGEKWVKKQPKAKGHPIYLPTKLQGATIMTYKLSTCDQDERRFRAPEYKAVDTCVSTVNRKGFQLHARPMCDNMTMALVATYSSSGCRPEKMTSLGDVTREQLTGCADISNINSMAFWCDGVPESEMGSANPGSDLFKILAMIFGIMLLVALLGLLSIFLRARRMMQDGERFWHVITKRFGRSDGQIQL